jgi:hypothetical protein
MSKYLNYPYALELIPVWCQMSPSEHRDGIGGCWGISHGLVEETAGKHCEGCEFQNEVVDNVNLE